MKIKRLNIFLAVILWIAIVIAINLVAFQYDRSFDLTQNKQHTLSKETHVFLSELKEDVKLTAFYVGMPPKYLEDLFNQYKKHSNDKVTFEIVDPLVQIGYAAQFDSTIAADEQRVVVQSTKDRRDIDFSEGALTENDLNNAILQVAHESRIACFLAGHGEFDIAEDVENGLTTYVKHLETNNIKARELTIGPTGGIPEECNTLVIAGAKEELSKEEIEIIQNYLEKGGDALFLIEHVIVTTPDKPLTEEELTKNPSLNTILNHWGVNVNDDIVVDLASHASGDVGSPATRNYVAHKEIVENVDYTFYIRPRSISMHTPRRETLKLAPIIFTESDKQSWGETNRTLKVKFDEGIDKAGPVPIAFVIFEPQSEGEGNFSGTRILVVTDADFLTNNYISYYNNALMGVKMMNWLTDSDYQVFVNEDNMEVPRLDLTSKQKRIVILSLLVIPLCILIMAFGMWIRGRN